METHKETISLTLYCTACDEIHSFSLEEIEQIVYCLQGNVLNALVQPAVYGETQKTCLKETLHESDRPEMYYGYVRSLRRLRINKEETSKR